MGCGSSSHIERDPGHLPRQDDFDVDDKWEDEESEEEIKEFEEGTEEEDGEEDGDHQDNDEYSVRDMEEQVVDNVSTETTDEKTENDELVQGQGLVTKVKVTVKDRPTVTGRSAEEAATQGRIDVVYPLMVNIVRIFTSSTFTDTKVERNALMERVYPKLKVFCQERGYEFQVVDMRWGVRDEATDDHMTSELCMREIDECQRLSTGPNFITFLAQKYGYRPFPPKINAVEFDAIYAATVKEDDKILLSDWFLRDDNGSPPYYYLQPIRDKLPDYVNDEQPEKKKEARNTWWATFERLQLVLRSSASKSLQEKEQIQKYYRAVTEEEIYYGILAAQNTNTACHWFKRNISNIEDNLSAKTARRFIDMVGQDLDTEANNLLSQLRDKAIQQVLPKECITEYAIKWSENGVDPEASNEHKEYIEQFCIDFKSTLEQMITNGITRRKEEMVTLPSHVEYIAHATFCQNRAEVFHGRKDVMESIKQKLMDTDRLPLVITGGTGSGKTSLVAKVVSELRKWHDDDLTIIVRFLGTSAQSSDTKDLLTSLCTQIGEAIGDTEDIPDSYAELVEHFKALMQAVSKPMCVVLDSLDQLRDQGRNLKEWIPDELDTDVWFILSTITARGFEIEDNLKAFLPESRFLAVPPLTSDDNHLILLEWFDKAGRTLSSQQMSALEKACNQCKLPLFTKIAFDQASRWKSSTPLDTCILGKTVEEIINVLFERVEKYHGKVVVSQTLGYITAARAGISSSELEDILSIDDVALNDVFQYHQPPLRRLAPLIASRIQADIREFLITSGSDGVQVTRWYHRQFQACAKKRYLATAEQRHCIRSNLIEFFTGKWSNGVKKEYVDRKGNRGSADRFVAKQPLVFSEVDKSKIFNLRKMNELPYHLVQLGDLVGLKEHVFMNFDWLYEKIRGVGIGGVVDDYYMASQAGVVDEEIDEVGKTLKLSKRALRIDAGQVAVEFWARLGWAQPQNHPNIVKLLEAAANPNYDCLFTSQAYLAEIDSAVVERFTGHEDDVGAMTVNSDRTKLLTCGGDQTFRLWDMKSGKEIRKFTNDLTSGLYISSFGYNSVQPYLINNDQAVVIVTSSTVYVFDLYKECVIQEFSVEGEEDFEGNLTVHVEGNTVFAAADGNIKSWNLSTSKEGPEIKVPPLKTLKDNVDQRPTDFLGGCKEKLVFHRSGHHKAQVVYLTNGNEVKDIDLITAKEAKSNKTILRLALTSGGKLVMYQIAQDKPLGAVFEYAGKMVVFDIDSRLQLRVVDGIEHGIHMGFEIMFPLTGTDVLFSTAIHGKQMLSGFNIESGKITAEVLNTQTNYIANAIGMDDGRFLMTYMQDGSNVHCINYHTLTAKAADAAETTEERLGDKCIQIRNPLPGTDRFQVYDTIVGKLSIWDLATRRCIRKGYSGAAGMLVQWLTYKNMIGISYNQDQSLSLRHVDFAAGEKLLVSSAKVYKPPDEGVGLGFLDENLAVIQGPGPLDISVVDLKQDKVTLTLSRPKDRYQMSGLMVSENKKVALLFRSTDPANEIKMDKDELTESRIYAFDLQAKCFIGNCTIRVTSLIMAHNVTIGSAVFTSDGSHYITIAYDTDGPFIGVADIYQKKWNRIPWPNESTVPSHVTYSKAINAIVGIYSTGEVITHDLKTLKRLRSVNIGEQARYITLSPDGSLMALNYVKTTVGIVVVNLQQMGIVANYTGNAGISGFNWSSDSCCLLVVIQDVKDPIQLFLHQPSSGDNRKYKSEKEYLDHLCKQEDLYGPPKEVSVL